MARLASNDSQSSSYSSGPTYSSSTSYVTTTVSLTLFEALQNVASGSMSASSFYSQAPYELTKLFDETSLASTGKKFLSLETRDQQQLASEFLKALRMAQENSARRKKRRFVTVGVVGLLCMGGVLTYIFYSPASTAETTPPVATTQSELPVSTVNGNNASQSSVAAPPIRVASIVSQPMGEVQELAPEPTELKVLGNNAQEPPIDAPSEPIVATTTFPLRTWTSVAGKSIVGSLVEYRNGTLSLMIDGQLTQTPLAKFSKPDLVYLLEQAGRQATRDTQAEPAAIDLVKRTWSDSTGSHRVEAALVSADNDSVTLLKSTGELSKVPRNRLSDQDQDYLSQRRSKH